MCDKSDVFNNECLRVVSGLYIHLHGTLEDIGEDGFGISHEKVDLRLGDGLVDDTGDHNKVGPPFDDELREEESMKSAENEFPDKHVFDGRLTRLRPLDAHQRRAVPGVPALADSDIIGRVCHLVGHRKGLEFGFVADISGGHLFAHHR